MAIRLVCRNDRADLTDEFPRARVAGPEPVPVFGIVAPLEPASPAPPSVYPVLIVCPECGTSNVFDSNALPPEPTARSDGRRLPRRFRSDDDPDDNL